MAGTSTQTIGRKDYEDHISQLHDCLIHHIFSFLPTREAVRTCVLSKGWRSVWKEVSDLRFSVPSDDVSFVDRLLTLYVWPKVNKFHMDIRSVSLHPSKLDSCVDFAVKHRVEDLVLSLNFELAWWLDEWWGNYTLPPLLNNCSSLTKLCLRGFTVSSHEIINWSSLKSLTIQYMGDDVLPRILMGSPVLEYLNLMSCRCNEIHSRSLRELVIDGKILFRLHIAAPCLLSLRVGGNDCHEIFRLIEAPSLIEAELDFDGPAKSDFSLLMEMLCKLQNATRILFGAWCLRVLRPLKAEDMQVSLPNCKTLTLHMPVPEFNFPAIANMLATTPNLEKLVIIFEPPAMGTFWYKSNLDSRNVYHKSYWQIKKKFKRWAQHLKNIEIFGFYACLRVNNGELLLLLKFLLEHASVLENMVIKVKNHKSQQHLEVVNSCEVDEVAQRLNCYYRASKHAAVMLNYLEEEHGKRQKKGVRVTTKCMCIGHKDARLELEYSKPQHQQA